MLQKSGLFFFFCNVSRMRNMYMLYSVCPIAVRPGVCLNVFPVLFVRGLVSKKEVCRQSAGATNFGGRNYLLRTDR